MVINSVEQAQQQFLDNYITFCFTNAYKSENKPTKHVEVIRVWPGLSRRRPRRWDRTESECEGKNFFPFFFNNFSLVIVWLSFTFLWSVFSIQTLPDYYIYAAENMAHYIFSLAVRIYKGFLIFRSCLRNIL